MGEALSNHDVTDATRRARLCTVGNFWHEWCNKAHNGRL